MREAASTARRGPGTRTTRLRRASPTRSARTRPGSPQAACGGTGPCPRSTGRSRRRGRRARSSSERRTSSAAPDAHSTSPGPRVDGVVADHLVRSSRRAVRAGAGRAPARTSCAPAESAAGSTRACRRRAGSAARRRRCREPRSSASRRRARSSPPIDASGFSSRTSGDCRGGDPDVAARGEAVVGVRVDAP